MAENEKANNKFFTKEQYKKERLENSKEHFFKKPPAGPVARGIKKSLLWTNGNTSCCKTGSILYFRKAAENDTAYGRQFM